MFEPIIKEYHGEFEKVEKDFGTVKGFTEEVKGLIRGTRIRVGRNLDGYPLGTGVTK